MNSRKEKGGDEFWEKELRGFLEVTVQMSTLSLMQIVGYLQNNSHPNILRKSIGQIVVFLFENWKI